MWFSIVNALENSEGYFSSGFDDKNPWHLCTMRNEAIVRPIQMIAAGVSLADIEAVAPNLLHYYMEEFVPLMEQYVQDALN